MKKMKYIRPLSDTIALGVSEEFMVLSRTADQDLGEGGGNGSNIEIGGDDNGDGPGTAKGFMGFFSDSESAWDDDGWDEQM